MGTEECDEDGHKDEGKEENGENCIRATPEKNLVVSSLNSCPER
jgi:hypothetical protein